MHTNHIYAIYWEPSGHTSTASYKSLINGYLQNVASANGSYGNVYATTPSTRTRRATPHIPPRSSRRS